jgi:hypothetical protein
MLIMCYNMFRTIRKGNASEAQASISPAVA